MLSPLERNIIERLPIVSYLSQYMGLSTIKEGKTNRPCPLHHEEHGQSFSVNVTNKTWSCYGKCGKIGKDVITLHETYMGFSSREEAILDLKDRLGIEQVIEYKPIMIDKSNVDEEDLENKDLYNRALFIAKGNMNLWTELDYIMSFSVSKKDMNKYLSEFIDLNTVKEAKI